MRGDGDMPGGVLDGEFSRSGLCRETTIVNQRELQRLAWQLAVQANHHRYTRGLDADFWYSTAIMSMLLRSKAFEWGMNLR